MIPKLTQLAIAIAIVVSPVSALAQRHGGGGGGPRPAPQAPRPAPAPMQRPAAPARAAGSFNFNRDIAPPQQRIVPIARPAKPARPAPVSQPVAAQHAAPERAREPSANAGTTRVAYHRAPATASATGGSYRGHFNGHPIENPRFHGNWAWNHGRAWNPAPVYWGGGFWGDFALASIAGIAILGSIDDSQDGYVYDSYQVQPDTPGADLLSDYGLQQTACGPPGLVDIWGPDGSVICAVPNDSIAPGDYQVDPESFTLVPATT